MAKTENQIYATMWVGYYKEGDDLAHHLKETKKPSEALRSWAAQLESAAKAIKEAAEILESKKGIEIDADTHHIGITGLDAETFKKLKKTGVVQEDEALEEESDEESE